MYSKERPVLLLGLTLSFVLFASSLNGVLLVKADSLGWQVDVYTKKEPYNGAGQGQPSDAFAESELVLLYANVSYNGANVQNIPVSFSVSGPPNPYNNISLSMTGTSNADGVAQTQFRIPGLNVYPENTVSGAWTVWTYVQNTSDFLIFQVGWIVQIFSIQAGGRDPPQGGWLHVETTLTSMALSPQNTTLSITISDSSGNILNTTQFEGLIVDPSGLNFSTVFRIPFSAAVGTGIVNATVLTTDGVPYGPGAFNSFLISFLGDLNEDGKVDMADIAIAAAAFGTDSRHPRWNPIADINKDGMVDLFDIALVSKQFGKG